jgi:trehalose 6-phosphate phosphatase
MIELDTALGRVAGAERLLVASDFDGTLSPIVDRPDGARPDRAACEALGALSRLPDTMAAVISGRGRTTLRHLLGEHRDGIRLVGSHGAEMDEVTPLPAADLRTREELAEALTSIAVRYAGALVELKPVGAAFHYRRVAEEEKEAASRLAREVLQTLGIRAQEGHEVVEGILVQTDKGEALDALRRALRVTATFFIGDDVTDERAFARLGAADIGVKVGPGPTRAAVRIDGQEDVGSTLWRLHQLRESRLNRPRATVS